MKGYSLQKAQNMLKINIKESEDNMRDFEKISFEQFKKDVVDDIDLYDEYRLPQRDSNSTAGYDIYLLEDSGEFVVLSYDGYIRTYFKPKKALEYFNRQ